jgi:hypothetical protein
VLSLRTACFAALFCSIPALVSCIGLPVTVDRQVQLETLEYHTSCLSVGRPAYSKAHTDCVLAHFDERQHELDRLRERVIPPPPPPRTFTVFPDLGPDPNFLI